MAGDNSEALPPPPPPPPSDLPPPPPPSAKPSSTKRAPIDIEALLQEKKEAKASWKPKFIPKKERELLAARKTNENGNAPKSYPLLTAVEPQPPKAIPTGPRAQNRGSHSHKRDNVAASRNPDHKSKHQPPEDPQQLELEERKRKYMGEEKRSTFSALKKRRRNNDKKFNFEWDASEDTTNIHDPLYAATNSNRRLGGMELTRSAVEAKARLIAQNDPETGPARAKQMLDLDRQRREDEARKVMHWSEKSLDDMRERDWRIFKEDFDIRTNGSRIPNPIRSWKESGLPRRLLDVVDQVGYTDPSPVQRAAIPIALQSRDLIGVAVTGSGKTAAFLLPLLVYISELPPLNESTKNDGPYAIILAPTRELAQQIELEARKFATPLGFTCVSLIGGHSLEEQAYALRDGAEIVIATPGRLVDCIERRVLVLAQCCYVIMDEADRMIDLGFEEPVNKILDALPVSNAKPDTDDAIDSVAMSQHLGGKDRYRQTMMYTATMPTAVERIARKYLRKPAIVEIGTKGEAVETVEQRVEFVSGEDKRKKRLADILMSGEFKPPIMVFVNIKRNCDSVARDIKHLGFSAVTLHGSKTQDQREAALASLRNGSSQILVATDVAGRGIDVPDVSLVVNFNMATSIEAYTHRIGRTGRAGKSGVATTFLGNEDVDVMYDLRQMLAKSEISRVPEELRKHEASQSRPVRGRKTAENTGEQNGGIKGGW